MTAKQLKSKISKRSIVALVFVAIGTSYAVYQLLNQQPVAKFGDDVRALRNNEIPNEQKPSVQDVTTHQAEKTSHPETLTISKLGILARVVQLGVDKTGTIESPANIHDVGWLKTTKTPTDKNGIIVIDGHVQGLTTKGVFSSLHTLKEGDGIVLADGAGNQITFTVFAKKTVPYDEPPSVTLLAPAQPEALELRLITCSGNYDQKKRTYDERLIVFARRQ